MKAAVEQVQAKYAFTERRACRLLLVPVSSYRYKPRHRDEGLRERLVALAREKPRFGYRRLHVLLGREGEHVNHKRVHRIYRAAGLALRRKRRKHCVRVSAPLGVYTAANQEWALDFVHDVVASGRTIRVLNVIDAYTRESLAMEVDTSFAGLRLTRVLDQIIAERGLPQAIRCDNGPELTSRHFLAWNLERKINLIHTQPGKPTQNGYVESFNGKLRDECLRINWFQNLFEARRIIANWRRDYNECRPHSSLNYLTPAAFAAKTSSGKDGDSVPLKNDTAVFHFPTATTAAG
jgi:putative transposase